MVLEEILVTEILKNLLPIITQQISLAWGAKDELRKLRNTFQSIQALMADAEMKQVNDATVRLWLGRLKDIAYDVDDVLDDFSFETMRRGTQSYYLKHKVRDLLSSSNPLVFRFKMAHKIRTINKLLDEIDNNNVRYTLQNSRIAIDDQATERRNRLTSSVLDDDLEILGREDDKSSLISILIDESSPSFSSGSYQQERITVISVVGMGGIGKTTLAQLVYKDKAVAEYFELKMWVCVSDHFDIYKILKNIIESITETKFDDPSNVDILVIQLRKKLAGKKYFLVLDDLWNENVGDWVKLKSILADGAEGSKILVTTRNQNVASIVRGSIAPYDLQRLQEDVCWSIIQRKAFFPGGAVRTTAMISIGREIARKCDGLPLAAKSLGGLMHSKRDESDWLSIKNNHMWDTAEHQRIISILKLSYDNLPSHLKQCFSYCCIFPKGWEIDRETLVRLWMARAGPEGVQEVRPHRARL